MRNLRSCSLSLGGTGSCALPVGGCCSCMVYSEERGVKDTRVQNVVHPRIEDTCAYDTLKTASLTSISSYGPHNRFSLSGSKIKNTQVNVRRVGGKSLVI